MMDSFYDFNGSTEIEISINFLKVESLFKDSHETLSRNSLEMSKKRNHHCIVDSVIQNP